MWDRHDEDAPLNDADRRGIEAIRARLDRQYAEQVAAIEPEARRRRGRPRRRPCGVSTARAFVAGCVVGALLGTATTMTLVAVRALEAPPAPPVPEAPADSEPGPASADPIEARPSPPRPRRPPVPPPPRPVLPGPRPPELPPRRSSPGAIDLQQSGSRPAELPDRTVGGGAAVPPAADRGARRAA